MPRHLVDAVMFYSDQHGLLPIGSSVVVGLSGGADSVFLLHVLCALRAERYITLIAAHLNHEWREQADADEQFCRELAESLDVTFVSEKLSKLAYVPDYNGSQEAMGRDARRFFFQSVCELFSAHSIALAHNAQDQIETFFIRLIRGASLSGLVSMQPRTGMYTRPLLATSADQIRAELAEADIAYLVDPTNESPTYLRNRIRLTVLPALRACDERFDITSRATIDRLADTEKFFIALTILLFEHMSRTQNGALWIDTRIISTHPAVVQQRLIIHWLCTAAVPFEPTEAFIAEILRFICSDRGGTHQLDPAWHIQKKRGLASIASVSSNIDKQYKLI